MWSYSIKKAESVAAVAGDGVDFVVDPILGNSHDDCE